MSAPLITSTLLCFCLVAQGKITSEDFYNQLIALDESAIQSDPILWKSWYAGRFAAAAESPEMLQMLGLNDTYVEVMNGTTMLLTSAPTYSAVLAFSGSNATDGRTLMAVPWLQDFLPGVSFSMAATLQFSSFANNSQDGSAMVEEMAGGPPTNVLCTGKGFGGALAALCGTWAITQWPGAHVTVITFGAPMPGTGQFNWTLSQLVDTFYLYPSDVSGYGKGKLLAQNLTDSLAGLNKGFSSSQKAFGDAFQALLVDATTIQIFSSNGTNMTAYNMPSSTVLEAGANITGGPILEGEAYDLEQLNETYNIYLEVTDCPIVLCKTRPGAFLSAMIYWAYDPARPDWIGPVPLDFIYPSSIRVKGKYDADAAVLWNPATKIVVFDFRGSESNEDWVQNAKVAKDPWPYLSSSQQNIWGDVQVHKGFLEQFQALTDKANQSVSLLYNFQLMSGNSTPNLVFCTGQSLGGALATLCGPWAVVTFPKSSVMVVTEGSPQAGGPPFVTMFNQQVGRAYRVVNGKDQVPLLPGIGDYSHVAKGLWLPDPSTLLLESRPPLKLGQSNWEDHNYYLYSAYQDLIAQVTVPNWVLQL